MDSVPIAVESRVRGFNRTVLSVSKASWLAGGELIVGTRVEIGWGRWQSSMMAGQQRDGEEGAEAS